MAGEDALQAYSAIQGLAARPAQAVALIRDKLRAEQETQARVAKLIRDLDADAFSTRQRASAELAALGKRAEPALRRALADGPTPEARERIHQLLRSLLPSARPVAELLAVRAAETLELINNADARQILKDFAKGDLNELLTREARASLERLARRRPVP
jgi:hypothetical protein